MMVLNLIPQHKHIKKNAMYRKKYSCDDIMRIDLTNLDINNKNTNIY